MTAIDTNPETNPLFGDQWHFNLMGNILAIWDEYSGEGVNVAVYDDGMDTDHEDLNDNYDASLEFPGNDAENNSGFDGHGTSVAGLIAAENNNIGGIGVAWGATLTSVDLLNDSYSNGTDLQVLEYAQNFDIVNQSYGYIPTFAGFLDIGDFNSQAQQEAEATYDAVLNGRDGLGTIFVKAAGNDANIPGYVVNDPFSDLYGVQGNAQGEGYNSLHFVITVGALDQFGSIQEYSSYGANLLVSAGAGAVTTDLTGGAGYSAGNYTNDFGGTSAAAPVTAGVVALMLEANPDLGSRDIQMILAMSAAMTGSIYGGPGNGYEVGDWMGMGGDHWNGGGLSYSLSYGFGSVDAFAAVRMAEIWSLLNDGPNVVADMVSQELFGNIFEDNNGFVTINNSSYTHTFTVTEGIVIEHLYVTVDMDHEYMGDLTIELITPDGVVIELMNGDGAGNDFGADWTFGVAALMGMSSLGEWEVRVTDGNGSFSAAQLWGIDLYFLGSEETNNDVYHITKDFREMADAESGRRMIGDDDGGFDAINMVTIEGDVVFRFGENQVVRVDGDYWFTQETGGIEGFLSGDGDDRVFGDIFDNAVYTGRGDDLIIGGKGDDELAGGAGNDLIVGGDLGFYGTEESAQVFRLFNAVFGREPGAVGHQNWMIQLLTGNMTLDQVAAAFMAGPEFVKTYGSTNNTEFVTLLFQNVLGRPPADAGLNAWVSNINNGMSREEVVRRISEGGENTSLTKGNFADFEDNVDATVYVPRIYRLFEAIFGREPGEAGFNGWITNFENGMTFEEATTIFMASQEFTNAYGTADNETFITTLFTNVLGRPPAESGKAAWIQNLENGMSRETVVQLFVDSREFINRTAEDLALFMSNLGDTDSIVGGSGDNILSGGAYSDQFVFAADDVGETIVTNWQAWDFAGLAGFGFATEAEALAAFVQVGDDVVFEVGDTKVIFEGADLSEFSTDQLDITIELDI